MSIAFSRSLRSLGSDTFRPSILLIGLIALLLASWAIWLWFAKISIYSTSDHADLEVERTAHPVASPLTGRVRAANLSLGRQVNAGDLLVELDAAPQELRLREERIQLASFPPQISALREEILAEEKASQEEGKSTGVALDEARARYREMDSGARFAESEAARLEKMFAEGLIPEVDLRRARTEAQSKRAAAESLRFAVTRQQNEQHARSADRNARIQQLQSELSRLKGDEATTAATVSRLENEVELRRIRAPIDGTLAEVASLKPGGVVREGETVGAVVPSGQIRVVAQFPPPAALGRIRPGQHARVRLEGFPWAQFGSVPAQVTNVASEVRDYHVRVELSVDPRSTRIPLQHGLPGSVDVEVERISPAALVERIAGQYLAEPHTTAQRRLP
jgi:multidrug resistance efflux pump